MEERNDKPKFKIRFDKYYGRLNFGFNFCYDDYGLGPDEKHWIEYYAIFQFGKYYLAIGVMG